MKSVVLFLNLWLAWEPGHKDSMILQQTGLPLCTFSKFCLLTVSLFISSLPHSTMHKWVKKPADISSILPGNHLSHIHNCTGKSPSFKLPGHSVQSLHAIHEQFQPLIAISFTLPSPLTTLSDSWDCPVSTSVNFLMAASCMIKSHHTLMAQRAICPYLLQFSRWARQVFQCSFFVVVHWRPLSSSLSLSNVETLSHHYFKYWFWSCLSILLWE